MNISKYLKKHKPPPPGTVDPLPLQDGISKSANFVQAFDGEFEPVKKCRNGSVRVSLSKTATVGVAMIAQ